jgi:Protein of unknown function (DUF1566)
MGANRTEKGFLWTGQQTCHDVTGNTIHCENSGQDAENHKGIPWPANRFNTRDKTVRDGLTGLIWLRDANVAGFPVTWMEALDYADNLNRQQYLGFNDWRVPNRRELRSLFDFQERKPALPAGHPFNNVFLSWYWTSTTAVISPEHAWYINMEGARMFYGGKDQSYLLWPVRGAVNEVLPVTGQKSCYGVDGKRIACEGTGQDAEFRFGCAWPEPRFRVIENTVLDQLTRLHWWQQANLTPKPVSWERALAAVEKLNQQGGVKRWRLPNINELESLVDCGHADPALPQDTPFKDLRDFYWSSTTSLFEPDWAWALYLEKGAVGVGQKSGPHFYVWPVCDSDE